jgi:adenosylmethionine-8-amino-7-oxononanoate aminotransferase
VGLAVLDLLVDRGLVDRVRERGPALQDELEAALSGSAIVKEVRGRGFLLGVELVDPRDGTSFLPVELDAAGLVDDTAFAHELLVTSTHPQADGYAGDQTLLAPAFTSTDAELAEMVGRFAATIEDVERQIRATLDRAPAPGGSR